MTIRLILIGAAIGAVFVLWLASGLRRHDSPLPAPLSTALAQHDVERVVDSGEIARWRAEADGAHRRELAALARAARAESTARLDSVRAVRLIAEQRLPVALMVRADEALTLRVAVAAEGDAVRAAESQATALDSGLVRSASEARASDSLLFATARVAREREPPCRVAGVLPCPSRRLAALGAGAFGFALAKGWVLSALASALTHVL